MNGISFLERKRTHTFCISGMAFQDAWTLDLERLQDCYIHTASPDGRLVPVSRTILTDVWETHYIETKVKITPLDPWISREISASQSQLTRQEIEAWQMLKLNETLALARSKSPFYRKLYARCPKSISSLDELRQFPFTTPDDISGNPLQFVCVSQSDIQRVVTLEHLWHNW